MSYREIDVSAEPPRDLGPQTVPILQWVKITDLVVDETYQRSLTRHSWAVIRGIAAGFDWKYFGAVAVVPIEGGRYAIIDGQHRVHGAAICGIEQVPAIVALLPVADQARAFAVINSAGIKVSPLQIYRAALASAEPWATACRDAVAAGGCRMMSYHPTASARAIGDVYAVTLIRSFVGSGRADVIRAGLPPLRVHAEAMGPMSGPLLFGSSVMQPWLAALASDPWFLRADLDGFLRHNRLMNLLENANHLRNQPEFARASLAALRRDALIARLRKFIAVAA